MEDATRPPLPWPLLVVGGIVLLLVALVVLQWVAGLFIALLRLALVVAVLAGLAWAAFRMFGAPR
jgi:hypothetical protein